MLEGPNRSPESGRASITLSEMITIPNESPFRNSLRCPNFLPRSARCPSEVDLWSIPRGTPERSITVPKGERLPRKRQAERQPSPVSLDRVHRIVGRAHSRVPNLQMLVMSLPAGRSG